MNEHFHENIQKDSHLTLKETFASELDIDSKRIADIADDMQSMLNETEKKIFRENNSYYIRNRAGNIVNNLLIQSNMAYQVCNRRAPKKKFSMLNIINKTRNFKNISSITKKNFKPSTDLYGKEQSVKMHRYDDNLPMALSVDNFETLYIPKTIQYIWAGMELERAVGTQLKADLQTYLSLTDKQRIDYMEEIMLIRNIENDDLLNDACDKELLNHRGIFAKIDISKMSIIGVYTGIFIQDAEDMMKLMNKMPLEHFQDYLFRISLQDKFPKISGYQYGNRLSLINAASNYQGGDDMTFDQICRRANILLVVAKTSECPIPQIADNENCPDIIFFVAGKDIPKGTQLLYDYGNVYW